MSAKRGEFQKDGKGFPTLELLRDDKNPKGFGFTLGLSKARLILENIEEIKAFVRDNTVKEVKEYEYETD